MRLPSKRAARVAVDRFASAPLTDDSLLDVHEAAAYLKCSTSWIYKRVEDEALPVTRLNGWGVRFMLADLKKWVGEQGGQRPRRRKG